MGALTRWERLGNLERQAPLLERFGRFEEAMAIYRRLGHAEKADTLEIRLLERHARWAEAGQRWESIGRGDEALRCYRKSGDRARALSFEAVHAEAERNWARAAECWSEIRSWEAAARCFRKAKDARNAALATARHTESQRDWTAAASAYRRGGDSRKADECRARAYENSGKLAQAAKILERLNQLDDALRLYRKIGDTAAMERIELARLNLNEDQIQRILSLEKKDKLPLAIKVAAARRAVLHTELVKPLSKPKRRQLWSEMEELRILESRCRATLAERAGEWGKAVHHWRRAHDHDRVILAEVAAAEHLPDPQKRAQAWMRLRKWNRAMESFSEAGDSLGVQIATAYQLAHDGHWASAAQIWRALGRPEDEARCLSMQSHVERHSNLVVQAQGGLFEDDELF
jgi:tetratricopeptide (TPR) repeat protein